MWSSDKKRNKNEYFLTKVAALLIFASASLAVFVSCFQGSDISLASVSSYIMETESSARAVVEQVFRELSPERRASSKSNKRPSLPVSEPSQKNSTRNVFQSPFIMEGNDSETARAGNQILAKNVPTKTFAVRFNCLNSTPECFLNNTYTLAGCPYKNCRYITSLEDADVVVFYVWRMNTEEYVPKFRRPPGQLWVMWTLEAVNRKHWFKMLDFPSLKGQFNWTMTYRLDSDIVDTYGRLQRQELPNKNYQEIAQNKKFPVAWFVSHCETNCRRGEYVERMQSVIDVHIYGSCGTYNCSSGHSRRESDQDVCLPLLSKSYHFYLAFENTLCKDYITEKFFKLFQDVDVIPVVRGGADYKRYFPPNTFVDASDFKSPEDLAKFLLYLSNDRPRYTNMLQEKSRYHYLPPRNAFCDLCKKMTTDDSPKRYPDLRRWLSKDQCHDPTDL